MSSKAIRISFGKEGEKTVAAGAIKKKNVDEKILAKEKKNNEVAQFYGTILPDEYSYVPRKHWMKTIRMLIAAKSHLSSLKCDTAMMPYVHGVTAKGSYILDVQMIWEKIMFAARVIASVEDPRNVVAVSERILGQRAVLKFSKYTKARAFAGRYTPGTFTNQIQANYVEPKILVCTDPRADQQAIKEASYVNLPVISLCCTDNSPRFTDIVIPCNNKSPKSIGVIYWLLTREVLKLRNIIPRNKNWDVMVDLFFYVQEEDNNSEQL